MLREYIKGLPECDKAKVFAYLDYLSEVGPQIRRPMGDYLGHKSGLYELRPGRHRVIYFYIEGKKIVLLYALLKKTKELPTADIDKALWRKEICQVLKKYSLVDFEEFEEKDED